MIQGNTLIRIAAGTVLAVLIVGFGIAKSLNLIEGPVLMLAAPYNGETVHNPLIPIEGAARNIAFLTLDDRQIYVDDSGKLYDELLLSEGYNLITLKAKDKFGREKTITREIIYKP